MDFWRKETDLGSDVYNYGISFGGPDTDGKIEMILENGKRTKVNARDGWQQITPMIVLGEIRNLKNAKKFLEENVPSMRILG